jgi:hypothetical protein
LTHLARLTVNLMRPAPIGECSVEVATDYVGRSTGHFSGRLIAQGKDVLRFTALMQREEDAPIPEGTPGHPPPRAPKPPNECAIVRMPVFQTVDWATATSWRIGSRQGASSMGLAPRGFG